MDTQPRRPVVLDMTPEGEFRDPPPARGLDRFLGRFGGIAAMVAGVAGLLVVAALAFAALAVLIPVAVVAGLVAWGTLRWRLWRLRRQGGVPPAGQGRSAVRVFVMRR